STAKPRRRPSQEAMAGSSMTGAPLSPLCPALLYLCLGRRVLYSRPFLLFRSNFERESTSLIDEDSENERARNAKQRQVANDIRQTAERTDKRCDHGLCEHRESRSGNSLPAYHRRAQRRRQQPGGG